MSVPDIAQPARRRIAYHVLHELRGTAQPTCSPHKAAVAPYARSVPDIATGNVSGHTLMSVPKIA
eukprot:3913213-Rhodomonas_salina.2